MKVNQLMASTNYNLIDKWTSTNRYTAAADVDALIAPTTGAIVVFDITDDDTAPTIEIGEAIRVYPNDPRAVALKSGERLWLATIESEAKAALGILAA